MDNGQQTVVERATLDDLEWLLELEEQCFTTHRISRRSMRRFLESDHHVLLLARVGEVRAGYVLVLFLRGTRLARIYSMAIAPEWRGRGLGRILMAAAEESARKKGAIYCRLEVRRGNEPAIRLYHSLGFQEFGLLRDYYGEHADAIRMEKRIRHLHHNARHIEIPWMRQNTDFTCGPATLMMAMAALDSAYRPSLNEELQIWREATTIFMTSGHGGCHPLGLGLAAARRGFEVEVWINTRKPLFVDGVRSSEKKEIIETVHREFVAQSEAAGMTVRYANVDRKAMLAALDRGAVPVVLISTYRLNQRKIPHWVVVSGSDERCFYVHDPNAADRNEKAVDCQFIPIVQEDFDPMSSFGGNRLRTAIILSRKGGADA